MNLFQAYDQRCAALMAMQNAGKIYRNAEPAVREEALKKARAKYQKADANFRKIAAESAKA